MAGQIERLYPQDMLGTAIFFGLTFMIILIASLFLERRMEREKKEKSIIIETRRRWKEKIKKGGFKILK